MFVRSAMMVTMMMIITSFFVINVIYRFIKNVIIYRKCQKGNGYVMLVKHLELMENMSGVHFALGEEALYVKLS